MNLATDYAYRPLFGGVFLTIQKFFTSFIGARPNINGEASSIVTLMGTPQAAFRLISSANQNITPTNPGSVNGQANLPLINFIAIDFRRVFGMENPYARVSFKDSIINSNGIQKINTGYSPQVWTINFQCSLWTNGYKERDDLMSKILTTFRHEVGLKWYYNELINPNDFIWVVLRMEENFTDDTNIEDLPEKDSRKLIRTSFTFSCQTALPYNTEEYSTIKTIQVNDLNQIETRLNSPLRWDVISDEGQELLIAFNQYEPIPIPIGF